jgi:hypothetical protein
MTNMRAGVARGMTLPRIIAAGLGGALAQHTEGEVTHDPRASAFHAPLREACAADPELADRAASAVRGVVAALAELRRFLDEEYAPRCPQQITAQRPRVWVDEQFVGVETESPGGLVGSVGAKTIQLARLHTGQIAAPDVLRIGGHGYALPFNSRAC